MPRDPKRRLLAMLGYDVRPLGGAGLLLGRRRAPSLSVEQLGASTWLVTGEGETEGPTRPWRLQRRVGHLLGEAQVAWALQALEINCVLDVGANKGQFARRIRRDGYAGRIVSFEPVPHFFALVRRAAEGDPDWVAHPFALASEDGLAEIHTSRSAMSSLLPSSDFGRSWHEKLRDMGSQTIETRRLSGLFDDAIAGLDDPRVFLKLDTQGYDLQAFHGAGDKIKQVCGLQSELSCIPIYDGMPRLVEQITEYEAAGFEIAGMHPVNIHRETMRVIEFDVVMVRPEAVRRS